MTREVSLGYLRRVPKQRCPDSPSCGLLFVWGGRATRELLMQFSDEVWQRVEPEGLVSCQAGNDSDLPPGPEASQDHPAEDRFPGASLPAAQNHKPGPPSPDTERSLKGVPLESMPQGVTEPEDGFHA